MSTSQLQSLSLAGGQGAHVASDQTTELVARQPRPHCHLTCLPVELLHAISSYLSGCSIANIRVTCQRLAEIGKDHLVQELCFFLHSRSVAKVLKIAKDPSWSKHVKSLCFELVEPTSPRNIRYFEKIGNVLPQFSALQTLECHEGLKEPRSPASGTHYWHNKGSWFEAPTARTPEHMQVMAELFSMVSMVMRGTSNLSLDTMLFNMRRRTYIGPEMPMENRMRHLTLMYQTTKNESPPKINFHGLWPRFAPLLFPGSDNLRSLTLGCSTNQPERFLRFYELDDANTWPKFPLLEDFHLVNCAFKNPIDLRWVLQQRSRVTIKNGVISRTALTAFDEVIQVKDLKMSGLFVVDKSKVINSDAVPLPTREGSVVVLGEEYEIARIEDDFRDTLSRARDFEVEVLYAARLDVRMSMLRGLAAAECDETLLGWLTERSTSDD